MRLFLAVDLGEALQQAAGAAAGLLRREVERSGRKLTPAGVSWVPASNLHVTLRFLGEVEPAAVPSLSEAVGRPFAVPRFDLELTGLGTFPPAGRPRIAWIGVGIGGCELSLLHSELEERLGSLGFPPETRPFRAHLTIARFRQPAAPDMRGLVARMSGTIGACRVEEVVLYESRLSPRGATYTALVQGALGGER